MQIGNGTFLQGDCLELMRQLPDGSVDMVFTSPPYNLGEGMEDKGGLRIGHNKSAWSGGTLGRGYGDYKDNMPYALYKEWQGEILAECWRLLSDNGAIFYNHKPRMVKGVARLPFFTDLPLRQIIIWDRGSGFNNLPGAWKPVHEWVMLYAKPGFYLNDRGAGSSGDVWRLPPERGNPHPAPFPVELVQRAIEATPCQTILDPFAGSGTTAIAAENAGRKWICMERDPDYYAAAVGRVWEHVQ